MIDEIIEAGATLDWITPALGLIGSLSGKMVSFVVGKGAYPTIENELRNQWIRPYHAKIYQDKILFYIKRSDVDAAKAIVEKVGWE